MKTIKQITIIAAIAVSGILFMACEKEEMNFDQTTAAIEKDNIINDVDYGTTVVDVVVAEDDLRILKEAVIYAGLAETLATINNVTVFAPTNQAFADFMEEYGFRSLEDIPMDVLTSVLLYHTSAERLYSSNLVEGYYNTLSTTRDDYPLSLYVIPSKGLLNATTNIVATDMPANNGVVHKIDKVLMPPTILNHALNNRNFSILVDAVVRAGLTEALAGDNLLTVFAPTNDAFERMFERVGVTGIEQVPAQLLTEVLLSHVVQGNVRSNMVATGNVQTLNPDKRIMLSVTDSGVMIDYRINVVLTDVQGTNGVIHVIDGVILPGTPIAERDYSDM